MERRGLLVTGATGLLGSRVAAQLSREEAGRIYVLVRDPERWRAIASRYGVPAGRVEPVVGDLRLPGLGVERRIRDRLAQRVDWIVHLAADIVFSRTLDEARATNLEGTRNLLGTTESWDVTYTHVSTAFVAGRETGFIQESDPGGRAGWVNAYEQSKWEAEQLVRGCGKPFLLIRPSTIVCDSAAGEVTQYNAVHRALRLIHAGLAPLIPGGPQSTVDLITTAYASAGIAKLARRHDLRGRTFHLCAGAGAGPLDELLETAFAIWSRNTAWRRRSIARPVVTDLDTYRLFEAAVEETRDVRLSRVMRSLTHFAPQLALAKTFDTTLADTTLGYRAPAVSTFWPALLANLDCAGWTSTSERAA